MKNLISYRYCLVYKGFVLSLTSIDIVFVLLFLLIVLNSCPFFHKAFAASPAFDQIFITTGQLGKKENDWVQTSGNDSTHLRSDYTNILAVSYVSDGKTLNATLWLKSISENASTYSQPFKKIRYGMLIAIDSLPPNSGYNGADYNFYVEAVGGKWSEYLYQLSSTGASSLIKSKINFRESFDGTTIGPGYVKLRLALSSIDYPRAYYLSFYTAESFKSNEVRDFTNWVVIPPSTIKVLTHPKNIVIRQGETRLIPAEMNTPSSNNVTSITLDKPGFSSDGLYVSTQRLQPTVFKVEASPQTPVGVYTLKFMASMLMANIYASSPTDTPATAPAERVTGVVDPEFQVSKKYPTIGYITSPENLTIDVISPPPVHETFTAFWDTYGVSIGIVAGGMMGTFATLFVEHLRSRREHK
jgi:hypothetical protein